MYMFIYFYSLLLTFLFLLFLGVSIKKNESCKKEGCEVNIIKIQLKENNSRVEGCILCDEEVVALLENR